MAGSAKGDTGKLVPSACRLNYPGMPRSTLRGTRCKQGYARFSEGCHQIELSANAELDATGNAYAETETERAEYERWKQALILRALACGNSYEYDVEGYDENGDYVYG
jgi:hypothetical protein